MVFPIRRPVMKDGPPKRANCSSRLMIPGRLPMSWCSLARVVRPRSLSEYVAGLAWDSANRREK